MKGRVGGERLHRGGGRVIQSSMKAFKGSVSPNFCFMNGYVHLPLFIVDTEGECEGWRALA